MRSRKGMFLRASRSRIAAGDRLVDHQTEAEQLRGNFTRHVIRRRSETACDQKDVAARKGIEQRAANGRSVRNGRLSADPQSEREKLLTEISEVGVCDVAEQQLGAGVEDLDVHKAAGLVFSGMLPVIPSRDRFGESDRRSVRERKFTVLAKGP